MKAIYQRAFERIAQKLTPSYLSDLQHYSPSVYHLFPRDDLRCLLKVHCKLIKHPDEEIRTIEVGKRLRASVQASEAKICQQCPHKENCKLSFQPGEVAEKEAIDDIMHFLGRLKEDEIEEKPRIYVAGLKILMALPQVVDVLKNDPELFKQYDVERLKLSEEREKKDEETQKNEKTTTETPKNQYKKERVDRSEGKMERSEQKFAKQSRQLFEQNEQQEDDVERERGERRERGNSRGQRDDRKDYRRDDRRDLRDRGQNKYQARNRYEGRDRQEGRDNRYNNRQDRVDRRSRSSGDWNDRKWEDRGDRQRYPRENEKREFVKKEYHKNDWSSRSQTGDANDKRFKSEGEYKPNRGRFEREFDYQRGSKYPREQRELDERGDYQRNRRFNNQQRPQRRGEERERAPRRSLDNLYQNASLGNFDSQSSQKFDRQAEGNFNRSPVPDENELSRFEKVFEGDRPARQGRKGIRGSRGSQGQGGDQEE